MLRQRNIKEVVFYFVQKVRQVDDVIVGFLTSASQVYLACDMCVTLVVRRWSWHALRIGRHFYVSWHTPTTPGLGLLLDRSVAVPKVGDYSWHGLLLARDTGLQPLS